MSELTRLITVTITGKDIERLFQLVNTGRNTYVDPKSHHLVDRIIELWFEERGYDFWNNPYPEVVEWKLTVNKEIEFKYVRTS